VRLEGLGQLKKNIDLIGDRTHDLPACRYVCIKYNDIHRAGWCSGKSLVFYSGGASFESSVKLRLFSPRNSVFFRSLCRRMTGITFKHDKPASLLFRDAKGHWTARLNDFKNVYQKG
jgi:hypothetical protein